MILTPSPSAGNTAVSTFNLFPWSLFEQLNCNLFGSQYMPSIVLGNISISLARRQKPYSHLSRENLIQVIVNYKKGLKKTLKLKKKQK